MNDEYHKELTHPGYDLFLKQNHLPSDEVASLRDVTFIPKHIEERLHEVVGDSEDEVRNADYPFAHDELGTGLVNSIADGVFSSAGFSELLKRTGMPPFLVEMLDAPRTEGGHALVRRIWSAADSLAKQQLKQSSPGDVPPFFVH